MQISQLTEKSAHKDTVHVQVSQVADRTAHEDGSMADSPLLELLIPMQLHHIGGHCAREEVLRMQCRRITGNNARKA
ncbi:hypothetical protein D2E26_0768 [Bifidobacterium dolichotidis]|uniref:Uncharacterized protein n=1 Tax=Bifidobacterium dolichotidis TaxID=2306976 RepID=A0A430FPI7_9BIFI|nr:hypothetical protein D2E26_0768 [Bifidobacterium dolichotidis]